MANVTEHQRVGWPVVYGFLRLPVTRQVRRAALTRALRGYCGRHEMVLGGVFTESAINGCERSEAFVGLLDVLSLPDSYGVVMPSPGHLGGSRRVTQQRVCQLAEAGARLIVMRGRVPQAVEARRQR